MLELKAIAIASTDPHTEVAPLIPHSQGAKEIDLVDASFIPRGNAIPINKPRKESIPAAIHIRITVIDPWNFLIAAGVINPKTISTQRRINKSIIAILMLLL
jgi:hypothetical protein